MKLPFDNCTLRDYPKGSITQRFGENPSLYKLWGLGNGHNGVDFVAYHGCPLLAVEDGEIISVKTDANGYGRHVRLLAEDREWTYGHLDTALVSVGQKVKEGDILGTMGNTGFVVSQDVAKVWWGDAPDQKGTHLHLGLRIVRRTPTGWSYPKSKVKLETVNYENGFRGGIDPLPFLSIPLLQKLVALLKQAVKLEDGE